MIDQGFIKKKILEAEQLERDSWALWDEATMNLAYGNLTDEMRDEYKQKTYQASRLHLQAMDALGAVLKHMDEDITPGVADLTGVTWYARIGQ